jgi:hypothetical protein
MQPRNINHALVLARRRKHPPGAGEKHQAEVEAESDTSDTSWVCKEPHEPRQYRKLSSEATRGEAVKHTPPPTQDSAATNRFAALISDNEGEDDEEEEDSGDDGDIGTVARACPAVGMGQQQQQEQHPGAPRLQ